MIDLDTILVLFLTTAVLACVAWGTVRGVYRLWRAPASARSRALLWGLVPVFLGGFLGYIDGSGEDDFIGFVIACGVAGLVCSIAVALWFAEGARRLLGSALFELVAALAWAYAGATLAMSVLRRLA